MNQIFLSYARADDETPPAAGDRPGWVKFFHDNLWYELKQRVSKDLRFWRDVNDIEPDGVFAREIEEAVQQAMLMVAVLSPNYIERPWCRRELQQFLDVACGPDAPSRSEQVFKILKHNLPERDLPSSLQNRGRGYQFFVVDPGTGIEQPFFMAGRLRTQHEQAYFDLINELAERIKARMPQLAPAKPVLPPPSRFVYVAPPPASSSVMEIYSALSKQLMNEGFGVRPRPGDAFPDTLEEAERLLAEALGSAELAIHLVGESGGKTCDGASEPMVAMQLRHSAQVMVERPELRRLIWLPGKKPPVGAAHSALLIALANCDAGYAPLLPGRDEIVSGAYDSFLGLVQRTLRQQAAKAPELQQAAEPPGPVRPVVKTLWVVAADENVAYARGEFRRAMRGLGADAEVPLPPDRPAEARLEQRNARLRTADSVVVLWGDQGIEWVEEQLYQLRHGWSGFGRNRPFERLVLALLAPDSDDKRDEEPAAPGDLVIDLRAGLDPARLRPLAEQLGAGR